MRRGRTENDGFPCAHVAIFFRRVERQTPFDEVTDLVLSALTKSDRRTSNAAGEMYVPYLCSLHVL